MKYPTHGATASTINETHKPPKDPKGPQFIKDLLKSRPMMKYLCDGMPALSIYDVFDRFYHYHMSEHRMGELSQWENTALNTWYETDRYLEIKDPTLCTSPKSPVNQQAKDDTSMWLVYEDFETIFAWLSKAKLAMSLSLLKDGLRRPGLKKTSENEVRDAMGNSKYFRDRYKQVHVIGNLLSWILAVQTRYLFGWEFCRSDLRKWVRKSKVYPGGWVVFPVKDLQKWTENEKDENGKKVKTTYTVGQTAFKAWRADLIENLGILEKKQIPGSNQYGYRVKALGLYLRLNSLQSNVLKQRIHVLVGGIRNGFLVNTGSPYMHKETDQNIALAVGWGRQTLPGDHDPNTPLPEYLFDEIRDEPKEYRSSRDERENRFVIPKTEMQKQGLHGLDDIIGWTSLNPDWRFYGETTLKETLEVFGRLRPIPEGSPRPGWHVHEKARIRESIIGNVLKLTNEVKFLRNYGKGMTGEPHPTFEWDFGCRSDADELEKLWSWDRKLTDEMLEKSQTFSNTLKEKPSEMRFCNLHEISVLQKCVSKAEKAHLGALQDEVFEVVGIEPLKNVKIDAFSDDANCGQKSSMGHLSFEHVFAHSGCSGVFAQNMGHLTGQGKVTTCCYHYSIVPMRDLDRLRCLSTSASRTPFHVTLPPGRADIVMNHQTVFRSGQTTDVTSGRPWRSPLATRTVRRGDFAIFPEPEPEKTAAWMAGLLGSARPGYRPRRPLMSDQTLTRWFHSLDPMVQSWSLAQQTPRQLRDDAGLALAALPRPNERTLDGNCRAAARMINRTNEVAKQVREVLESRETLDGLASRFCGALDELLAGLAVLLEKSWGSTPGGALNAAQAILRCLDPLVIVLARTFYEVTRPSVLTTTLPRVQNDPLADPGLTRLSTDRATLANWIALSAGPVDAFWARGKDQRLLLPSVDQNRLNQIGKLTWHWDEAFQMTPDRIARLREALKDKHVSQRLDQPLHPILAAFENLKDLVSQIPGAVQDEFDELENISKDKLIKHWKHIFGPWVALQEANEILDRYGSTAAFIWQFFKWKRNNMVAMAFHFPDRNRLEDPKSADPFHKVKKFPGFDACKTVWHKMENAVIQDTSLLLETDSLRRQQPMYPNTSRSEEERDGIAACLRVAQPELWKAIQDAPMMAALCHKFFDFARGTGKSRNEIAKLMRIGWRQWNEITEAVKEAREVKKHAEEILYSTDKPKKRYRKGFDIRNEIQG